MVKFDENFKREALDLWNKAEVEPTKLKEVDAQVKNYLLKNKDRYVAVSKKTRVPWFVIGCLHYMEGSCNFTTHLHNGDSLKARTIQVPAGRPKIGTPPFSWEDSAIDALGYDHLANETDWSIPHILYLCEAYNGFGYRSHNVPSAYVWAGTTVAKPGRYIADRVWSATSMSTRCACASMLKTLIKTGEINTPIDSNSVPAPLPAWITLKNGSKGDNVKLLQTELNEHFETTLTPDGNFGNITEKAVKVAEKMLEIPIDGVVTEDDFKLIKEFKKPESKTDNNAALIIEATKYLGVHEEGGNNKGIDVEKFQKAVDGKANSEAWCMAFVQYCIKETENNLGIKSRITRSEHCLTTWRNSPVAMKIKEPVPGCVVIWQHGSTDNGHTGFVTGVDSNGKLLTIEGNTDSQTGINREGNGVFARIRNNGKEGDMSIKGFLKVF
jgi:uncharacterized protein (TIGR02594 family)